MQRLLDYYTERGIENIFFRRIDFNDVAIHITDACIAGKDEVLAIVERSVANAVAYSWFFARTIKISSF